MKIKEEISSQKTACQAKKKNNKPPQLLSLNKK
jgi:hypothetical protein